MSSFSHLRCEEVRQNPLIQQQLQAVAPELGANLVKQVNHLSRLTPEHAFKIQHALQRDPSVMTRVVRMVDSALQDGGVPLGRRRRLLKQVDKLGQRLLTESPVPVIDEVISGFDRLVELATSGAEEPPADTLFTPHPHAADTQRLARLLRQVSGPSTTGAASAQSAPEGPRGAVDDVEMDPDKWHAPSRSQSLTSGMPLMAGGGVMIALGLLMVGASVTLASGGFLSSLMAFFILYFYAVPLLVMALVVLLIGAITYSVEEL